jgi:hypothetical protein
MSGSIERRLSKLEQQRGGPPDRDEYSRRLTLLTVDELRLLERVVRERDGMSVDPPVTEEEQATADAAWQRTAS